ADGRVGAGVAPGGDAGRFFRGLTAGAGARGGAGSAPDRLAPAPAPLTVGRDVMPHGGSLDGDVAGEVVFVGHGITAPEGGPDDYAGMDVRGKIALALDGPPAPRGTSSRLDKLIAARRHGAAALLLVTDPLPPLDATLAPGRRASAATTPGGAAALPARSGRSLAGLCAPGAPAAAPTGVRARLRVSLDREDRRAANVIGVLPGSDPSLRSEAVVVGAHYD